MDLAPIIAFIAGTAVRRARAGVPVDQPRLRTNIPDYMRAAIYARFSTDLQSASSIEDQTRVCRARAESLGYDVVAVHSDRATSGASLVIHRPGGAALLEDALAGRFEALIVEALDRLSRDAVDVQTIIRRLEHRGIRVIGATGDYDTASGRGR